MATKDNKGNWINGVGESVPVKYVPQTDKIKDKTVTKLIKEAKIINAKLSAFKKKTFDEIESYMDKLELEYGVQTRTLHGNKQLTDFSNAAKIELQIAKKITFDEKLNIAKSLIDECITKWSDGADEKLKMIVMDAFKVDKSGKLDRERILGLRKLKIKDEKWKKAMDIISDSLTVASTKAYIRFSEKDNQGNWHNITLDIANA